MSLESGQRLSLEELKQRNTQPTAPEQEAEQAPPPEVHPTAEEWDELLDYLHALDYQESMQTTELKKLNGLLAQLPASAQMDELLKRVTHLEQMTEQAGRPKEKRFSLPNIRLPRLDLPHLDAPTWVVLLMALAALLLLWLAWAGDWNNLSLLNP